MLSIGFTEIDLHVKDILNLTPLFNSHIISNKINYPHSLTL